MSRTTLASISHDVSACNAYTTTPKESVVRETLSFPPGDTFLPAGAGPLSQQPFEEKKGPAYSP